MRKKEYEFSIKLSVRKKTVREKEAVFFIPPENTASFVIPYEIFNFNEQSLISLPSVTDSARSLILLVLFDYLVYHLTGFRLQTGIMVQIQVIRSSLT